MIQFIPRTVFFFSIISWNSAGLGSVLSTRSGGSVSHRWCCWSDLFWLWWHLDWVTLPWIWRERRLKEWPKKGQVPEPEEMCGNKKPGTCHAIFVWQGKWAVSCSWSGPTQSCSDFGMSFRLEICQHDRTPGTRASHASKMAELMGRPQLAIVLRPEDSTAGQIWFRDVQGVSHPQMDGWLVVWWLIGGLEHEFYDFPFSWGFHKPNWRSQIFQRGRYTTNQNGLWRIWIQHFTRTPLLRPRLQRLREAAWVLPRWPEDSVVKRLKQDMFRGYMNSTAGQLDGGFIMFNL